MEARLVGQRQQQRKKELQPEETPSAIKKDGELLNFPSSEEQGRGCRSLCEKSCAIVWGDDADTEVIAVDSGESSDESTELCDVSQKNILSPCWEPRSGDGGRYSGRLRTRTPISKRSNLDFATHAESGFSTDESENYVNCLIEQQLRNVAPLPNWGKKKHRTDPSSCKLRQVSGPPRSNQATQRRNLRRRAKSSQDGLTFRSRRHLKNNPVPFGSNHRCTARSSARSKHEICSGNDHLGRSLHDGNAVPVCRNVSSGSPLPSLGGIGSSCKRSKLVRRGNMVTHMESFPRELRGHHEEPVTSMKPPMRKRKAETGADDLPDYHGVNALSSGRAWSDGTEREVQQQCNELTSDAEEVTENSGFASLFRHSPPLPANLPFSTLQEANIEEFLNGETGKGDAQYDTLDAIVNGEWSPSLVNGCQSYPGRESNLTLPLNDPGAYIGPYSHGYSQGGADVFSVPDTDVYSIASEPSTNDSLGAAQSDEDYHPPGKDDNVGTPIPTGYPSRSRRSLTFRNDSVARRVGSISTLRSDVDPAPSTPSKAAHPMSNTPGVVNVNPIPDNPYGPVSTTIDSATNDARAAILEAPEGLEPDDSEDLEPDDENVLDEEDEDGEEGLFNLNEPPSQQPQKNSKARKKHRPKVFREGRPYRRRKPKEDTSKTKGSEGKTEVEKPKARKKQATADFKSSQGDLRKKQGTQTKPVAATCGPAADDCAQCQENRRRGMDSQDRRTEGTKESSQTPVPVLRRGPKNSLILGEAFDSLHAQDCSPFSSRASGSRSRSRKRAGEDSDRLNGAISPAIRLGVRRELFKRARGKRTTAIVEDLGFRENCQESLNEATDHVSSISAVNTVEAILQARTDASHSPELVTLASLEGSTQGALVDPCLIAAEFVGAAMPRKRKPTIVGFRRAVFTSSSESSVTSSNEGDPEEGEEGISGHTYNLSTEVGLKGWSKIAGKEIILSRNNGRMRAAARAKAGHLNLSKRGKRPPSRRSPSIARLVTQLVKKMANLELNENELQLVPHVNQTALVPYDGPFNPLRKKKLRAKVMLEEEDKRVWRLLMAQGTSFEDGNSEKDAPRDWEDERATMKARAEKFINRMHLVQGDRRFSIWKGSVVDSVVGAFLTQNVSDHLSSSAFMCIAARFPVPRKKNVAADTSQETTVTVTEVRVEEASEISQKSSGLPVSSDDAEPVQEGSKADYHVEEAFDNNEKSSVTGEGLSMCGNQQAYDTSSTKVPDGNQGRGPAYESLEGSTSQDHAGTESHAEQRLTEVREQNSSCSSNPSQGQCCSPVHSLTSQAGESLAIRGSEQQKTCGVMKDFTSLHSGPGDVFCVSSGHNDMNSISRTALMTLGDREVTQMAIPAADGWIQTDSQLLEGSLIVDLSPILNDRVKYTDALQENLRLFKHIDILRTLEVGRNSVSEEKIRFSDPPRLEMTSVAAEEVAVSSGSVVSSSGSFDGQKLSHVSVLPGSEANCVVVEEHRSNAGGLIFPSDNFDANESYDQQLVPSENTNNQLQGGLSSRTQLSYRTELSNLHTLKGLMRHKIQVRSAQIQVQMQVLRKARTKRGPNSRAVNGKNNSEIISSTSVKRGPNSRAVNGKNNSEINSSTSVDQAKESGEKKRRPVVGLTGIARAKLEESNITSKVAFDWEAVRLKYTGPTMSENQEGSAHFGSKSFGSSHVENGVDWDAVRSAKLEDIAEVIKERGMNNVLAGRIKAFLERVQKEHGSVDLEWLRTVSVEEAKSFLLSVRGLGLKSVECIRLLTLHHLAFPVDTNVGRICVRLGWVPLEPLPEELQLHLLELYPVQETIQKYLWPRLCSLDQRTLYELHYQMITFGKVFCTKSRPNCNACPMRDDCQHFASALASSRLALQATAHEDAHSTNSEPLALPAATAAEFIEKAKLALPPSEDDDVAGEEGASLSKLNSFIKSQKPCEPIIEEPRSPEPVAANVTDIEDMEDYDTFVGVSSQPDGSEKGSSSEAEMNLPPAEVSIHDTSLKAMVLLPPGLASIPVPKLKNVGRLRTVHYVYELPDNHPLVQEMDPREADDPCVYLLAIWSPGESPQAPPVLDDPQTDGTCDGFNNSEEESVRGTLLVPCRTAMRGIFPLNGTYFQVNEVFADHASSIQPIEVPRTLLWNLRRRFVYFGTSVTTIFKGLSTEEIQACFWRGYVCVRGFDNKSRCPRPLAARLHFPASKMVRKQKGEKNSDSNAWAEG